MFIKTYTDNLEVMNQKKKHNISWKMFNSQIKPYNRSCFKDMLNKELFTYIYKHRYGATVIETKQLKDNDYLFIIDEIDEIDC